MIRCSLKKVTSQSHVSASRRLLIFSAWALLFLGLTTSSVRASARLPDPLFTTYAAHKIPDYCHRFIGSTRCSILWNRLWLDRPLSVPSLFAFYRLLSDDRSTKVGGHCIVTGTLLISMRFIWVLIKDFNSAGSSPCSLNDPTPTLQTDTFALPGFNKWTSGFNLGI